MNITKKIWIVFIAAALFSTIVWWQFSYPRLAFLNLKINRTQALTIAREYLSALNYPIETYTPAVVFEMDEMADLYLQTTIGFEKLKQFAADENYDMFYWQVRFFREKEKEEYRVTVSADEGEVIRFRHIIEETAARERIEREQAKEHALLFLKNRFDFQPEFYSQRADLQTLRDFRDDFIVSWHKNDVNVPWTEKQEDGSGRLVTTVMVSGQEILEFTRNFFKIPDLFKWHLDKEKVVGQNIFSIVKLVYYALIAAGVFFITMRGNHVAMHLTKSFYCYSVAVICLLSVASLFNLFPQMMFNFNTSTSFRAFFFETGLNHIMYSVFTVVAAFIPGIAGETIHFEVLRQRPQGSFLYYLRSTFFSRDVALRILFGYLIFFLMLGVQSLAMELGRRYWGVWIERNWMAELSTMYVPFLAALTIALMAAFSEEIMFRLFAVNLGIKIFRNPVVAIVLSALIWGFGHSNYAVFPMWFRGVEVSCLGLLLGFTYYHFGIIAVIVAHFLFDAFWQTAGYLLGDTQPIYFWSSVALLLLPAVFAAIAYWLNQAVELKDLRWHLTRHQQFNLGVIKGYLNQNPELLNCPREVILKEFLANGWDPAVIETAIDDLASKGGQTSR